MYISSPALAKILVPLSLAAFLACAPTAEEPAETEPAQASDKWNVYEGAEGPGQGKHVVMLTGDEEYHSAHGLSQLAKILATRHGFKCTVLYALDPETGIINPTIRNNIPGTEALATADLMFVFTRWRNLPNEQMKPIDDYLRAGKPVIGIRTATHGFAPPPEVHQKVLQHVFGYGVPEGEPRPELDVTEEQWGTYGHYGDAYVGPKEEWKDGFGRLVVGERWVAHHGHHKHESTLGVIAEGAEGHPILRGIGEGDIWGPSDVYTVRLPLPEGATTLVLGQVMKRKGEYDENDPLYGMRPDDGPPVAGKNDPMMPVAWTKPYQIPGGTEGQVFATTMGASTDLLSEGVRRMLVNAVYWAVGMDGDLPETGTGVALVGSFEPEKFNMNTSEFWEQKQLRPADLR